MSQVRTTLSVAQDVVQDDRRGTRLLVNGRPTYPGTPAEGLLFNIRTVNATFDDTLGEVDWWHDDGSHAENDHAGYGKWSSPESAFANTERFVDALGQYRDWGVLAVNLNFQGGHPLQGKPEIEEGKGSANSRPNGHRDFYHNSGFRPDGTIDDNYARRIASVIDACDRLGMAVILQLFYFGQDTVFKDEDGIRGAVDRTVDFVCEHGWRNVIVEIANEVTLGHYHHEILRPARVSELVLRVRERARARHDTDLLVSTSEAAMLKRNQWTEEEIDIVFGASDVVLLHGGDTFDKLSVAVLSASKGGDGIDHGNVGDRTEVARKIEHIRSRPWYSKKPRPVIFNESDGELAFEAAVERGVSFGLHSTPYFQTMFPPRWGVWDNETMWFFRRVRSLTRIKA